MPQGLGCKVGDIRLLQANSNEFYQGLVKLFSSTNTASIVHSIENELIEVELELTLPQYPVVALNNTENLKILFHGHEAPEVWVRDDFPVVPHLNVYPDKKTLCLFDLPFEEIKHLFSSKMFLDRIHWWFTETARGKLHKKNQLLEPYFPFVSRSVIISQERQRQPLIRLAKTEATNVELLNEVPLNAVGEGEVYIQITLQVQKKEADNIINAVPSTLGKLNKSFDSDILNEAVHKIYYSEQLITQSTLYKDFFSQTRNALKNSKLTFLVQIHMISSQNQNYEYLTTKIFVADRNLGYFNKLHQPLLKEHKNFEKCFLEVLNAYSQVSLKPYNVLQALTPLLAQRYNNDYSDDVERSFVQLGVGALGSQLADHCIRAGYGDWLYVDFDVLLPHNLARHCLTIDEIGKNKAKAMAEHAASILSGEERTPIFDYRQYDIIAEKDALLKDLVNKEILVDTSASVAVSRYLSSISEPIRCVSFFLNPTGTALIMLAENKDEQ